MPLGLCWSGKAHGRKNARGKLEAPKISSVDIFLNIIFIIFFGSKNMKTLLSCQHGTFWIPQVWSILPLSSAMIHCHKTLQVRQIKVRTLEHIFSTSFILVLIKNTMKLIVRVYTEKGAILHTFWLPLSVIVIINSKAIIIIAKVLQVTVSQFFSGTETFWWQKNVG